MQHSWEEHDEDSKPKAKEKEKEKEKAMPRWGGASGSLDFRSSLRSRQLRRVIPAAECADCSPTRRGKGQGEGQSQR